jgi:Tfp pilus assembly protein PilP
MIEAPISTPPKAYMDIISPLINSARGFLESGEALQAFAFVGSLSRNQVVPVMIQSGADAVKVLHGGQRPIYASAASQGRRRATDDFALTLR